MICPDLTPKQRCFRCFQYRDGQITETFHEHIPAHRMSQAAALEAARGLVATNAQWPHTFVLNSLLNSARGGPQRYPGFRMVAEYPEPGVFRHNASGGNDWAWFDVVINPKKFRQ
jgi:hypothetical protein